jgi:ketosteroid isomerase-like protein
MSQKNIESLRQGLDAVNRRDKAAWLALCDPELENIPPRDWPESDPIRGSEPVFDFYVEAQDAWGEDSAPYRYDELIDVATDKVAAWMSADVQGKASGARAAWGYWQVVTFRNGKVLRIEWFGERAEALEAVGQSRQDADTDSS